MKEYERYNFNESRYVMRLAVPSEYFTEEIIESKFYAKSIEMRFENDYFCVPIDYDKILRNLYGDYNKLPPLEKRRIHHMTAVYWKE
ncbi:MAG: LicD family protein [Clostridium neonatale]